jgi:hypothetical protein
LRLPKGVTVDAEGLVRKVKAYKSKEPAESRSQFEKYLAGSVI